MWFICINVFQEVMPVQRRVRAARVREMNLSVRKTPTSQETPADSTLQKRSTNSVTICESTVRFSIQTIFGIVQTRGEQFLRALDLIICGNQDFVLRDLDVIICCSQSYILRDFALISMPSRQFTCLACFHT